MIPRTFPPAPGWSPDGHRIKNEIDYSRGPEKTWVYGALRPRDGQEITMTAPSRNSAYYQQFLQLVEDANPHGDIYVITDNLSSHNSVSTRTWLEDHPASHTRSSRSAHAGSTCRKAGGDCFARPLSPGAPSAIATTSPTRPAPPPTSSTPAPDPGSGADPHHPPDAYAADMCTSFEERSTSVGDQPRSHAVKGSATRQEVRRSRRLRRQVASTTKPTRV
ncbi:transposase [Streptomyces sp. KR55]|uniref:transposase n=1 Tax=Streptomyces sp. KR55 TaxID=3457425 RepID=UPI003FD04BE8